jgi:hypothetical protein
MLLLKVSVLRRFRALAGERQNGLLAQHERTFTANYDLILPPSFLAYPTLSTGQNSSCRRFLPEACGFSFAFVLAFYVSSKFLFFRV